MSFQHHAPTSRRSASPALLLSTLASALALAFPAQAAVEVDQNPARSLSQPAPNVTLMLDNSASMRMRFMPDHAVEALTSPAIATGQGTNLTVGKTITRQSLLFLGQFPEHFPWASAYLSRWQSHILEGRLWFDSTPKKNEGEMVEGAPAFNVENGGGLLIQNSIAYNPLLTYRPPTTGEMEADGSPKRKSAASIAEVNGLHFYILRSNDNTHKGSSARNAGKISNYNRYTINGSSITAAKITGFTPRTDTSAYGWIKDKASGQHIYIDLAANRHGLIDTSNYGSPFAPNSYHININARFGLSATAPVDQAALNGYYRQREYLWGVIDESRAEQVKDAAGRSSLEWVSGDGLYITSRSAAEEVQNFANWHKYYRSRWDSTRVGVAEAFATVPEEIRLGLSAINEFTGTETYGNTARWSNELLYAGVPERTGILHQIPTNQDKGLFKGTNRSQWYKNLFDLPKGQGGTPLRNALHQTGEYYSGDQPYGPANASGQLPSCRRHYTILATDGYWNGPNARAGDLQNEDGTLGVEITGWDHSKKQAHSPYTYQPEAPYADNRSGTLADVAMKYWKNDLKGGDQGTAGYNDVPITGRDPAFWQHMTVYAVSIGLQGLLDQQKDWKGLQEGTTPWPNPASRETAGHEPNQAKRRAAKIDDLWHAAVNSRGDFYVANDHETLTASLKQALEEITSADGAGAAGTLNKQNFKTDKATGESKEPLIAYWSEYRSSGWSGDLVATERHTKIGEITNIKKELWRASEKMPDWDDRKILFNNSGTLTEFTWAKLPTAYKTLLGSTTKAKGDKKSAAESTVEYLRGNTDLDGQKVPGERNVKWRQRYGKILGDFVHSQPVLVGAPLPIRRTLKPFWQGYDAFREQQKNRKPVLYIGGNDGMLHAFNADYDKNTGEAKPDSGKELFAFMPQSVFNEELKNYTRSGYLHHYFVDGELTAEAAKIAGTWKTILYGSLARGGDKGRNSIFALDITDPDDIKLLWEKTVTDLGGQLGQSIGKARMVQVQADDWKFIVPLGPNSGTDGTADGSRIALVDVATGSANTITLDASGLGVTGVHAVDTDKNGEAGYAYEDTVYAGDLSGGLYKVSNIATTPTVTKIFQTLPGQAITAAPNSITMKKGKGDPKKRVVLFGTGKQMVLDDQLDKTPQAWYGIYDENDGSLVPHSLLVPRHYVNYRGEKVEACKKENGGDCVEMKVIKEDDMKGKKGWKMDLAQDKDTGRTAKALLQTSIQRIYAHLWVNYYDSAADNCDSPIKGRVFGLNPQSGAIREAPTDLNKDKKFDDKEDLEDGYGVIGYQTDAHSSGDAAQTIARVDGINYITSSTDNKTALGFKDSVQKVPSGYTWREIIAN